MKRLKTDRSLETLINKKKEKNTWAWWLVPVGSMKRPKGQYSRPAWTLNTVNTVTGKTHTGKNREPPR